jgi:Tfp pilus assembly PilM family ATPase
MPRYLAIEWDEHQLRALVASTSGRSVTLERAGAIDLPATEHGKDPPPETIGKALADWIREQGVSRSATLVAVGRASIELRRFSMPPAPDNELPEMVRFQAQREFSSLTEDSPLDFLPLSGDATTPRQVLAAALSPDLLAQIRSVCDAAGLKAERIVLRPCATAAVVRQAVQVEENTASMVVDPLLDEVDLAVLVGEKVVFIRTVRLPHVADVPEDESQYRPLLGELRRTMAAFHNQFREVRISSITVCGDTTQRAALAEAIGREFSLPTSALHPLEAVPATARLKEHMPAHPGRYAPLVGMVLDEVSGSHAIDFLNPRKKPEERTNRLTQVLAAAAVLMALGLYAWWQYDRISDKKLAVQALQTRIDKEKKRYTEQLEPIVKRVERVDQWVNSDVNWLDELAELSRALRPEPLDAAEFPQADDVVATKFTSVSAREGGQIKLNLAAKSQGVAMEIEERIQTEDGDLLSIDDVPYDDEEALSGYPWNFPATEHVSPPAHSEAGA